MLREGRHRLKPPQQPRSAAALERILDTARQMLLTRRFHELSINDLCIAADVSVSSFYARFPSKDALLFALLEEMENRSSDQISRVLQSVTANHMSREELVRIVTDELILYARVEGHLEQIAAEEPVSRERIRQMHNNAAATAITLASAAFDLDAEGLRAAEFAVRSASAVVYRAVSSYVEFANEMHMDDTELAERTAALILAYLAPYVSRKPESDASAGP